MKAIERLKVTAAPLEVRALPAVQIGEHSFERGGHEIPGRNVADAYTQAAALVKAVEAAGYKFTKHGPLSHKMDVFVKGTSEVSISVHNQILNVDVW